MAEDSSNYIGRPFVDVTHKNGPTTKKFSDSAPEWSRLEPGVSLAGPCTNAKCDACDEEVDIILA